MYEHLYSCVLYTTELNWLKNLQTPFPLDLNENIYQSGNIFKDASIDIFKIFPLENEDVVHMVIVKMVILKRNCAKSCPFQTYITFA